MEFDWDQVKQEIKKGNLSLDELILILLYIGKISGKNRLQQEVFLVWKEIFKEKYLIDPMFQPDFYGPHSQLLEDLILKLNTVGYVRKSPRGEGHVTYIITEKGKFFIKKILEEKKIPDELFNKLRDKKMDWDELTFQGLIRYICRNYPEYFIKEEEMLKEKVIV